MEMDTCLWDEIQDAPGEIFDFDDDLLTAWENTSRTARVKLWAPIPSNRVDHPWSMLTV